jgi:hypothetical protein
MIRTKQSIEQLRRLVRQSVPGMRAEDFDLYFEYCLNRGLFLCTNHSCYHGLLMDSMDHVVRLGAYHGDFVRQSNFRR